MSNTRIPDILECLSNLSNDEVFTTPALANQILDTLPAALWSNKNATFLDPFTKSGVFLREITKRLLQGLEKEIPDLQERINHILKNQVFGIATTELTSLVARRSVYCSKKANSEKAITTVFEDEQGNIIYEKRNHEWKNGKCKFCGANQQQYERSESLEQHAYPFLHTQNPLNFFNEMKFDVIVGNPPYQMSDGGAQSSASPLYDKFILQAKKMNPQYLIMIVPARWYAGGKGLDDFREEMLSDKQLKEIHDFPETSEVFPGVNIRGGVCFFLWENGYNNDCKVFNYYKGNINISVRPLLEKNSEVFIRFNQAVSILRKVQAFKEESFAKIVSSRKPFGLPTNFKAFSNKPTTEKNILLYRFGDNGYINENQVENNKQWINEIKIIVPKASPGADVYPHLILSRPIIANKQTCCTETYLVVGPIASEKKSVNIQNYMLTQFFRFMILLIKNTQDVTKKVYQFVPMQNFDEDWTDEKLYKKYGLEPEEIAFIESMVRPMQ